MIFAVIVLVTLVVLAVAIISVARSIRRPRQIRDAPQGPVVLHARFVSGRSPADLLGPHGLFAPTGMVTVTPTDLVLSPRGQTPSTIPLASLRVAAPVAPTNNVVLLDGPAGRFGVIVNPSSNPNMIVDRPGQDLRSLEAGRWLAGCVQNAGRAG